MHGSHTAGRSTHSVMEPCCRRHTSVMMTVLSRAQSLRRAVVCRGGAGPVGVQASGVSSARTGGHKSIDIASRRTCITAVRKL